MEAPEINKDPGVAFEDDVSLTASRFTNLKAKIKAECQRRAYVGSVTSYAGSSYDYSAAPATDTIIKKEHYEKIAVPMNAITGDIATDGARIVSDAELTAMETKVTTLSNISLGVSQANTGCNASCTGLCSTGCYDSCTSCTSCSGCSGCGSGCAGCSGCGDGCTGCGGSCGGNCGGSCSYNCSGGCQQSCTGGCSTSCSGCTGSCDSSCWSSAAGGGTCGALCTAMCQSSSTN